LIPKMRGRLFSFYKKSEGVKTRSEIIFSKNAKLFFIIISDQNISEQYLSVIKNRIGKKKYSEAFFLLDGIHPNDPKTTPKLLNKNINKVLVTLKRFYKDLKKII